MARWRRYLAGADLAAETARRNVRARGRPGGGRELLHADRVLRRLWPGLLPPPHLTPCWNAWCEVGPGGQPRAIWQAIRLTLLLDQGAAKRIGRQAVRDAVVRTEQRLTWWEWRHRPGGGEGRDQADPNEQLERREA